MDTNKPLPEPILFVVIETTSPFLTTIFLSTNPRRILGPCKSPKIDTCMFKEELISLMLETVFLTSSCSACEKFTLKTLTPARIKDFNLDSDVELGPRVAIILVLFKFINVQKLNFL